MLKLSPTLLIGLGGTGKSVLLRVRKLFFERQGQTRGGAVGFPLVGYLVLDTDAGGLDEPADPKIEAVTPAHVRERIRLQQGDIPEAVVCRVTAKEFTDYFTGKEASFPHVFGWMPAEMGSRYQANAMENGAGQNRLFGRLAFFHHYRKIRKAIEDRLADVIEQATKPGLQRDWLPDGGEVDVTQVEVVLAYSLAGGTGCGMFLDVGFLVQDILATRYPTLNAHLTHFVFLPGVLTSSKGVMRTDDKLRVKVHENAFAALKEMEYFANRSDGLYDLTVPPKPSAGQPADDMVSYRVRWERDAPPVAVRAAPWDTCYLIDGTNDPLNGSPIGYAELYQMVAEHLFLDFDLSDFGSRKRSARSNLIEQTKELLHSPVYDQDGKELFSRSLSRKFSVFGLAQIEFDRDRMRRAAAHRLAGHLVEWWLTRQTPALVPEQADRLAAADLGPDGREAVPTPTRYDTDPPPPLSYMGVTRRLLRRDLNREDGYPDELTRQADALRAAVEAVGFDPLTANPFPGWERDHTDRLQPATPGAPAGPAVRGFDILRGDLEPRLSRRVEHLFRHRVTGLGLRNAAALFKRYAAWAADQAQRCDRVQAGGEPPAGPWAARLADARRIPLKGYARVAARAELLRGVDGVKRRLGGLYQRAVAPHARACLQLLARRVGADPAGSYAAAASRFIQVLDNPAGLTKLTTGVRAYLDDRFGELSRADHVGRPDARTVALMEAQDAAEYDRRIARALGKPDLAGLTPDDWAGIEQAVMRVVAAADDPRLAGAAGPDDVALSFFPPDADEAVTQPAVDRLADALARGCEALLGKFATEVTALRLFEQQPNRPKLLDHLRIHSAPYLRRNQDVAVATQVDVNAIQYLGLADHATAEAQRFEADLRRSGEKDQGTLTGLRAFRIDDDAIVLYQEKAGVPLCYAACLDDLGRQYDASVRRSELHLDPFFRAHAPEVRRVNQTDQRLLAQCLEYAVQGVMTGLVRYKRAPGEFSFFPASRYGIELSLGSHLDSLVRGLVTAPDVRGDLVNALTRWLTAAAANDGERVAVLWAAHFDFYQEIRERVRGRLAAAPGGRTLGPAHPLLSFLQDRMIRRLEERLADIPAAVGRWVTPLRPTLDGMLDLGLRPDERAAHAAEWRRRTATAFTVLDPDSLPVPVLAPQATFTP